MTIKHLVNKAILTLIIPFSINATSLSEVKDWFVITEDHEEQEHKELFTDSEMAILPGKNHPSYNITEYKGISMAIINIAPFIDQSPWSTSLNEQTNNYTIDVTDNNWYDKILLETIPTVLAQGFNGIVINGTENITALIKQHPETYINEDEKIILLISDIRKQYYDIIILIHNSFDILDELAPYIDGIVAESLNTYYDKDLENYTTIPDSLREYRYSILKELHSSYNTPVFVLDYASWRSPQIIRELIDITKKEGFIPYIAERNLNKIYNNQILSNTP